MSCNDHDDHQISHALGKRLLAGVKSLYQGTHQHPHSPRNNLRLRADDVDAGIYAVPTYVLQQRDQASRNQVIGDQVLR